MKRTIVLLAVLFAGCHAKRHEQAPIETGACSDVYPSGVHTETDGRVTLDGEAVAPVKDCRVPRFFTPAATPHLGNFGDLSTWFASALFGAPKRDPFNITEQQYWSFLSVRVAVPPNPTDPPTEITDTGTEQAIAFFPGIMSASNVGGPDAWIAQPVLFYYENPPASGKFGWYVTSVLNNGVTEPQQMTQLVQVYPDDLLYADVSLFSISADTVNKFWTVRWARIGPPALPGDCDPGTICPPKHCEALPDGSCGWWLTEGTFRALGGAGVDITPMALELQGNMLRMCDELPPSNLIQYGNLIMGIPIYTAFGVVPSGTTLVFGQGSDGSYTDPPHQAIANPRCNAFAYAPAGQTFGGIQWDTSL